jgi:hypothetical protein
MKRYKITLPDNQLCDAMGIKFEGLETRTRMWLMGVASGVAYSKTSQRFNLFLAGRDGFTVETNSASVLEGVTERLESMGCSIMELTPDTNLETR